MEDSAADLLQRARNLEHLHQIDEALQACDAALLLEPTNAAAYMMRAKLRFFANGNPYASVLPTPSEADQIAIAADLEQVALHAAYDIPLLMECAFWMTLLRSIGKITRALEICTSVIALDPTYSPAYLQRAFVYHTEGQFAEALADYTEAIRLTPTNPAPYAARGRTYEALRQRAQAAADFQQALALGHTGSQTEYMRDYVRRYGQ